MWRAAYWCLAREYRNQGDLVLANRAYENAVLVEPNNPEVIEKLAEWKRFCHGDSFKTWDAVFQALQKQHAASAVILAGRWLQKHPFDFSIAHAYAEMMYKLTRYDEATRIYLNALDHIADQRKWFVFVALGEMNRYRGQFPDSEEWFRKASLEMPENAAGYIFLGAIQARQGKLKDAESTHRRATQCTIGRIDEAHYNLGLVLRGRNRLSEAADSFRKALELCPEYPEAKNALDDVESAILLESMVA